MSKGAATFRVTAPSRVFPLTTLGEVKLTEESWGFSDPSRAVDASSKKTIVLRLRIALLTKKFENDMHSGISTRSRDTTPA
ncbi:hypothetical protein SBA1_500033 [Candidatus Sulfotelmatobacter kueseliae]|uniref:Uncharacterized protein n=1 Tax=Candidatus Sulfotelmatobacter kueseliae TaxID=2042962 RepID=A0A2U3KW69_9BACT|nr:hypothetical protein SBA1_500033 [Candidatus Sulfotelmatobacter kueseliae]